MKTREAAKRSFFDRAAVKKMVGGVAARALSKFGAVCMREARQSIRKRKRASTAGSPPSSHTGLLHDNIFFSFDPVTRSVVIGPAKLNKPGEAVAVLEEGGFIERRRTRRGRGGQLFTVKQSAFIQPRPYMRPAFERTLSKLRELVTEARLST